MTIDRSSSKGWLSAAYSKLKQELAATSQDMLQYCNGKDAFAKIGEKIGCTQAEITQEEDCVLRLNKSIPVLNKPLIHLVYRLERASGVTNDVCMRKVSIRYEPPIHFELQPSHI